MAGLRASFMQIFLCFRTIAVLHAKLGSETGVSHHHTCGFAWQYAGDLVCQLECLSFEICGGIEVFKIGSYRSRRRLSGFLYPVNTLKVLTTWLLLDKEAIPSSVMWLVRPRVVNTAINVSADVCWMSPTMLPMLLDSSIAGFTGSTFIATIGQYSLP